MMVVLRDKICTALQFVNSVLDTVDGTLKLHGIQKRSVVPVEDCCMKSELSYEFGSDELPNIF